MTPSAILLNDEVIRIFGGCRDKEGVSRIRYIDVLADNPKKVIRISKEPILDVGSEGCFDDNGVILGDVIPVGDYLYMYYVGFQHVQKVKFLAFSGLAISKDHGETFQRYSNAPVLDRSDHARYIRAIHTVIYDKAIQKFRVWYAIGDEWKYINGNPYPSYDIWYTESDDGIHFSDKDDCQCIKTEGNEYRIGRPKVYASKSGFEMYYTRDFIPKDYVVGYAKSTDGKNWTRYDDEAWLTKEIDGDLWDSEMACYPVILKTKNKKYMFYNGNGMGYTGVGYAEQILDEA